MITLDASVLIAHLDASDPHHEAAEALLLETVGDGLTASSLTVAEVLVAPARAGRLADAEGAIAALELIVAPLSEGAAPRLAQLRVDTGLRLPDCCVLLTALDSGGAVATFDSRQATSAESLGIPVVPSR